MAFPEVVRLLCATLVLCALVFVPVAMGLAHPPLAATPDADAHAHAHDYGAAYAHGDMPAAGHDLSDHDQPVRLLPVLAAGSPAAGRDRVAPADRFTPPGAIRDGPRRPPRLV
jgi:hypothetical protein